MTLPAWMTRRRIAAPVSRLGGPRGLATGIVALAASTAALLASTGVAAAAPWPTAPASSQASVISDLFWLTLVLAAVVFVLVEGLLIYSSIRFRRRTPYPLQEPPQIRGSGGLEVMWTIVPAVLLIGLFGISLSRLGVLTAQPTQGVHVTVTAHQFAWDFRYPDSGVTTSNDLHVPVGEPVILSVTSQDVIHSFWVPQLGSRIDASPGHVTGGSFVATQPGTYRGVCAELCGAGHDNMMFTVTAVTPAEFQQWLQQQKSGGAAPASSGANADVAAGKQLVQQKGCGGCHTIPGIAGANGKVGPDLAGVASRKSLAGGAVTNNGPADIKRWIMNAPAIKPGTDMPNLNLTSDQADKIVAFLETLK